MNNDFKQQTPLELIIEGLEWLTKFDGYKNLKPPKFVQAVHYNDIYMRFLSRFRKYVEDPKQSKELLDIMQTDFCLDKSYQYNKGLLVKLIKHIVAKDFESSVKTI